MYFYRFGIIITINMTTTKIVFRFPCIPAKREKHIYRTIGTEAMQQLRKLLKFSGL